MNSTNFQKEFDGSNWNPPTIISERSIRSMHWQRLTDLKNLTKYIEFDCNFEGDKCDCVTPTNYDGCCCVNCANNMGYLDIIPYGKIGYYSKLFTKKEGFWRSGKGCILPVDMRSSTCLTYYCKARRGFNEMNHALSALAGVMKKIEWELIDL